MRQHISIIFSLLILPGFLTGQAFTVDIEVAPPYPTELDYYLENASNLFISVSSNIANTADVYYHVRVVGDNGIDVYTMPTYKPGEAVTFQPFETKPYVGNDLQADFPFSFPEDIDLSSLSPEQYDFVNFYRALPEGTYELCVRVIRFDNNAVIANECSDPFTVSYGDAPHIYMPYNNEEVMATANSLVNIGWEPPFVSNPGLGVFQYTLEMIDITDDPFGDIELMFSNPGTYDILYTENLSSTIYNYSFPPESIELSIGHTYALRVRAIDITGSTPVTNNGYSPISLFTYTEDEEDIIPPPLAESDCTMPCVYTPAIPGVPATSIGGFDVLDIGNFRMSDISFDNMDPLSASGSAKIDLEFLNGVSINVIFENVSINTNGRIYDGEVTAVIDHEFDTENMSPEEAQAYEDFLLAGRIMEELVGENPIGLPIAFTQNIAGSNLMLGINSISFTPTQATCSIVQNMHIPKLGFEGWLPMESEEVCLFPSGFGEAILQPMSDIVIPYDGGIEVVFETDNAKTSIAIDCNGIQSISLGGTIKFPENTLVKENSDGTASNEGAEGDFSINIDEQSINDAIGDLFGSDGSPYESGFHFNAEIEMEPFRFAPLPDWGTSPFEIYIDLSDFENPPNFQWPENYTSPHLNGNSMDLTWHGAYMPGIEIYTPDNFMGLDESKTIDLETVLVDPNVNFKADVEDFISFEEGNVDGWAVSVDELHLEVIQNALSQAGFNGLLSIPITAEGEDFEYDALMSYGSNDTYADYILTISSLDDITFPFAVARADLSSNSYVSATFNPGNPQQNAIEVFLEGGLAVQSSVFEPNDQNGYAPPLELPAVDFSLNYHSKNGFTNSHFGFSQPAANPYFDPDFGDEYNNESLGGFPLNISDVYLTGSGNDVRFQFNPEITIAPGEQGISVEGEIYVDSKYTSGKNKKLVFEKIGLSELEVDANPFGINLQGGIEFYEDTKGSTVRSGVKGDLSVGFPMGLGAKLAADFGNQVSDPDAAYGTSQNFNYWFLDGMVYLPAGVPIGTSGLGVYGFGGGVYVNMTTGSDSMSDEEVDQSMGDIRNLAASSGKDNEVTPTGAEPAPKFDNYGLKIAGALGTIPEHMINMDLSIYGEFSSQLGLNMLSLSGDVYHLTSINDRGEGGFWSSTLFQWEKHTPQYHVYSGEMALYLDMFALTGNPKKNYKVIDAEFYAESGGQNKWFFHAGNPEDRGVLEFDLFPLPKISTTGYFMAGHDLPNDLPIPQRVMDILDDPSTSDGDNSFDNPAPVSKNGEKRSDWDKQLSQSAKGLAFGATLDASAEIDAFLLYGRLSAFCGFDINITQDPKRTCYIEGEGDFAPGWNDWYARGQVYAGLEGALGIEFRFCKKDYDIRILELAAAIMAGGGGPNPVWVEGRAGVYYSVLNGLFEGHKQFDITIGDKCVPAYTDPFSGVDIIYETYPTDEQTDVSPFVNPTASFILPIDESFTLPVMNEDGSTTDVSFKLNLDQFELEGRVPSDNDGFASMGLFSEDVEIKEYIWDEENKQVSADLTTVLNPFTSHDLTIKLKGEEKINGSWVTLKDEDGDDWYEKKEYQFTTGNLPYPVPDDEISYCYPARRHKYLLQDEVFGNPFLMNFNTNLKNGQNGYFPEDDESTTYKYWLRFQDLKGGAPVKKELEDIENQSVIDEIQNTFPDLINNTIYSVQLLRSEVPKIQQGQFLPQTIVFETLDLTNEMSSNTTVNIDTDPLDPGKTAAENEAIIYQYYFKTSQFNTLEEKLANAEVTKRSANAGNEEEDYPLATVHLEEGFDAIDIYGVYSNDELVLSPRVSSLVESNHLDGAYGGQIDMSSGDWMSHGSTSDVHVSNPLSNTPTHKGSEGFFDYCTDRVDGFYDLMDDVWEPNEPYFLYTAEVTIYGTDKFDAAGGSLTGGGIHGTGGQAEIISSDGTTSYGNQSGTINAEGSGLSNSGGGNQTSEVDIEWDPRKIDPELNFHPDERPFKYYFSEYEGVEGLLTDGMINGAWNVFQKNKQSFNDVGLLLHNETIMDEKNESLTSGDVFNQDLSQFSNVNNSSGGFQNNEANWNFGQFDSQLAEEAFTSQHGGLLSNEVDVPTVNHPASLDIYYTLHPRGIEDGEAMAEIANDYYFDVLGLYKNLVPSAEGFFEESLPNFWDNYGKMLNVSGYHYIKHNGQYPLILQPNKGIGPDFLGGSNYNSFTFTKF